MLRLQSEGAVALLPCVADSPVLPLLPLEAPCNHWALFEPPICSVRASCLLP